MKVAVSRAPGEERVVTPLELFFDLVYVFAIGQLSHHLLAHVDLRTGAETAIMTLAVIYAWYMVAWGANWLDPDRAAGAAAARRADVREPAHVGRDRRRVRRARVAVRHRLPAPPGRALGVPDRGPARPAARRALRQRPRLGAAHRLPLGGRRDRRRRRAARALGSRGGGHLRSACGACTGCPAVAGASTWSTPEIAAGHLIERFRLFFIIALGETVLTTGTAFTDQPFTLERLLALAIGFTGTVALWWCYFQRAEGVGVELPRPRTTPAPSAWSGTWTLTLIVLALIGIAVGDELAIAHPGDDATLGFTDPHVRRAGAVPGRPDAVPPLRRSDVSRARARSVWPRSRYSRSPPPRSR